MPECPLKVPSALESAKVPSAEVPTSEQVIELLGLRPLPEEGGMFTQHFADEHSTAIYFLVRRGDFSALHRLSGPEVYHFYSGDPLQMLLLHPDGTEERPILGVDLAGGQRPSVSVSGGVWQGSETTGEWSLLGATMAPGFRSEMIELGHRDQLIAKYPNAAVEIGRLTR